MPEFALGDAELTRRLELWHMSCACTGMPRRDLENLFEYGNVTPEQRLAQLREMKPTTALGETFQYSNLMVAAGGFVAAHAYAPKLSLTEAYAKVMQEKLFAPLGMTSSTIDFAVVTRSEHASPHALDIDGRPREIALGFEGNVGPIAPAGAVWSNLRDMERYALTELARGVAPGGTRVVSEKNFAERLRPRAPDSGYGLGVGVHKVSGLTVIGHDGGADGFGTSLLLIPEFELGLIILTNVRNGTPSEQLPFNAAVKRKVLELLFKEAQIDSAVIIDFALTQRREAVKAQTVGVEREPDLSAFFGHYVSESLGAVDLRPGGVFDAGEWQVRVGRRNRELVVLNAPFAATLLPLGGDATTPTISAPDPQASYVFKLVTALGQGGASPDVDANDLNLVRRTRDGDSACRRNVQRLICSREGIFGETKEPVAVRITSPEVSARIGLARYRVGRLNLGKQRARPHNLETAIRSAVRAS